MVCYVDASNLNAFRASLAATVNPSEEYKALLTSLTARTFDNAQVHVPTDLPLQHYTSVAAEESAETSAGSTDSSPAPASGGNRRDRRKRGAAEFKDWQALSKWNMLVTALTLPAPSAPVPLATGRDSVTAKWTSQFEPAQGDKTRFGFRLQACEVKGSGEGTAGSGCVEALVRRGEMAGALPELLESLDAELLKHTGTEGTVFRATLRGLRPSTEYTLRVQTVYDQADSQYSAPAAASLRTNDVGAPNRVEGVPELSLLEEPYFDEHAQLNRIRTVGVLRFSPPTGTSRWHKTFVRFLIMCSSI
jgi:hypothetical protein